MTSLALTLPDDWHIHLRDGAALATTVPDVARWAGRAIVMPNLTPPVLSVSDALSYRERILAHVPGGGDFDPLMVLYLTDATTPEMVAEAAESPYVQGIKLYPAGATTNSAHGVTDVANIRRVLQRMEAIGMPLLVHGEVTDHEIDIFDREAVFIERILAPLIAEMPRLKVVFEHITTAEAVAFVDSAGERVGATITPQHLHINRNAMLVGGIRPHAYCLPVAKREQHRLALRKAATSGSAKYFLGTDSAPHSREAKENACGCAGIFNAPYALESYTQVFDEENALDRLEGFASLNGPKFYGLPVNEGKVTLRRQDCAVAAQVDANGTAIVPFHAGETLRWTLV